MRKEEKHILISLLPGFIMVMFMWAIHIIATTFDFPLYKFGVHPRTLEGIKGIFLSPFIHADYKHLFANSLPVLFLSGFLFHHYIKIAKETFFWIYILTGVFTWCLGRDSYHIGASGIIYGLAFMLFVLGLIRRDRQSMGISMVVVFLYGGLFWGLFPLFKNVSWEAHLSGAIAGVILAFYFKKEYPKIKPTPEPEIEYEYEYWKVDEFGNPLYPPPIKEEIEESIEDNIEPEKPKPIVFQYVIVPKSQNPNDK